MCRLYGFQSSVLSGVHQSLVAAENALGRQSAKHRDGWGVAYYVANYPHVIRSEKQALEDNLFRDVSGVVSTHTLLAHIRLSTTGGVGVLNCHPFQHGPWTFAHNGCVASFNRDEAVRERMKMEVDPRFRRFILGNTDSELAFYLFLSRLARQVEDICHIGIRSEIVLLALKETVEAIVSLAPEGDGQYDKNNLTFLFGNDDSKK